MILVNGIEVKFETFPNGETKVISDNIVLSRYKNKVDFKYTNDSDIVKLMFIKMFLDDNKSLTELYIHYMPYSRMDRVEGNSVFTLKYVTNLINILKFSEVVVIEPHSDVTTALLNRSRARYINFELLPRVEKLIEFDKEIDYLFFPDAGAQKRYHSLKGYKQLVGYKNRDFKTGEIESLDVVGNLPEYRGHRKVLIVDDLSSYGGTFLHSANKLKELLFSEIYLLVAHCENSIYQGKLLKENSPIKKIFTTNSILTLGTEKIHQFKLEELL